MTRRALLIVMIDVIAVALLTVRGIQFYHLKGETVLFVIGMSLALPGWFLLSRRMIWHEDEENSRER